MDIKNLNTFIQVAELNNFTKAAEKLGYSQSTVSFQIRQLEEELNAQLFERINRTVLLTERGREVLKYAHQISKLAEDMSETVGPGHPVCGHVRLAMADSLCSWLMEEKFEVFHRRYPGISLKIITAETEEMFRLLNHNEVDLVCTLDKHIYHSEYVNVKEEKVGIQFVAAPDCSLAGRPQIFMKDLIGQPFILTEKGMSYRKILDEQLARDSLEIHPVLETGNVNLICRLVEQRQGISFLPDYATGQEVAAGRMAYLPVCDFEIDVWQQLLYHRDKWVSPAMEAVMAELIQL